MPAHTLHTSPPTPGPTVLDLLETLLHTHPHLALLHSADNVGHSILATTPIATAHSLQDLQSQIDHHTLPPTPHPICWIGTLSYDLARDFESIGSHAQNDLPTPTVNYSLYDTYFIFNHAQNTWTITSLNHAPPTLPTLHLNPQKSAEAKIIDQLPKADFLHAIHRIQHYIAAGDIYQANYAQRWKIQTNASPVEIYRRLCAASPAAYAAFISTPQQTTLSASPELLLERIGNHLRTRPIKGTRPRDLTDPARDQALRNDLLTSEKDRAELTMIVDLLRNDLGRISRFGSVRVTHPRTLEQLPTLWHTTATIESQLAPDTTWPDILRALHPGGSVTGAPKIRAMQIIEELETHRRNLYCGSIGLIQPHGNATLNIAIRTIQMHGPHACIYAGGGIVADSNPEEEYAETLHKAAALFRALELTEPVA